MSTTKPRNPAPPKGLRPAGRALWTRTVGTYALRVDELAVLEQACRSRDLCSSLAASLEGEPLTTRGSRGQVVANPLLGELRAERLALSRMLRQLGLPDDPAAPGGDAGSRSTKARAAALERWRRPS